MEPEDDWYELLEVRPDARPAVIEAAYRQLVKDYHPDHHAGDAAAAERMKRINRAHDILSDPAKRALYDRKCEAAGAAAGAGVAADLPTLDVEPAMVELRPNADDEFLRFSVHVRQSGGPPWQSTQHLLDIAFESPWQPSMFSMVRPRGADLPVDIDFELRLGGLDPASRHSGAVRIEARRRGSAAG